MSDLPHWHERAHLSRLRARRRRRGDARASGLASLRRRGVLAFVAAMSLSVGGAVAHHTASSAGTGTGTGTKAKVVRKGAKGPTVRAIQAKLGIPADGIFGRQTRRAVKRFQRRNGLAVDGIVGPVTLRALGLSQSVTRTRTRKRTRTRGAAATLRAIARCESGGNPRAVSPDGRYRGKYQFSRATWRSLGGEGDPAKAPESVQDRLARKLYRQSGTSPWPACAARL